MNLLKKLFGGSIVNAEEERLREEVRNFDVLKYSGVKALKDGQTVEVIKQ